MTTIILYVLSSPVGPTAPLFPFILLRLFIASSPLPPPEQFYFALVRWTLVHWPNHKKSTQCCLVLCQGQHSILQVGVSIHLQQIPTFRISLFAVGVVCTAIWSKSFPPLFLKFLLERFADLSRPLSVFYCLYIRLHLSDDKVLNLVPFFPWVSLFAIICAICFGQCTQPHQL